MMYMLSILFSMLMITKYLINCANMCYEEAVVLCHMVVA